MNKLVIIFLLIILAIIIYGCFIKQNFGDNYKEIKNENKSLESLERIPNLVEFINENPINISSNDEDSKNKDLKNIKDSEKLNIAEEVIKEDKQASIEEERMSKMFRMETNRKEYSQEHFVNIYDTNFGGILPTTLGTNP